METRTIRQSVTIAAGARDVYEALADSKRHARFTRDKARISRKVGGAFSCYGGYITGINLELAPGRLIVQAWRSKGWPEGHYSVVSFRLSALGPKRTRLDFVQIGVPAGDVKAKSAGWKEHYWTRLKSMLEPEKSARAGAT